MRDAWNDGGPAAAAEVGADVSLRFGCRGGVEDCAAQLAMQADAGVDLHQVAAATDDDQQWADLLARLLD